MIVFFIILLFCQVFSQSHPIEDLISLSGLSDISEGSVKLMWSYPGPDRLPEGAIYYIQYTTFTNVNWSTSSAQISISTGPVEPFSVQTFILSGLDKFILENSLSKFTTFYFGVFVSSANLEVSFSNIATGWMTLWPPYVEILECNPGVREGEIVLKIQASDDYINTTMMGVLSGYFYIQYTDLESFVEWSTSAAQIKISTHSFPSYIWSAGYTLTGLLGGTSYYIRIWAEDELGNLSEVSNKITTLAQVDISSPRRITCIYVSGGFKHVKLSWIFPYEDSYEDGFLYNSQSYQGKYEIKYHNVQPILDESLWLQATQALFLDNVTITPNISTTVVITNLKNNTSYYFSIKTADENSNWSLASSSSPLFFVFNSRPNCLFPEKHFTYDPLRNKNSTVISSSSVIFDWSEANWHAGFSLSDQSYDEEYGDFVSSYTLKISTFVTGSSLGNPIILFEGVTSQTYNVHNLADDTTYFWTLTVYDSEGASSTTAVFKFTVNFQNTPPRFPTNPIITPNNTVVHTKTGDIVFDFKDAYDVDIFDYIVGYKIFLSTSQNFESFITIPQEGLLTTSYFLMTKNTQPSSEDLLSYENMLIYWYVVAYDSGSVLGYLQLSTTTPIASFWLNQKDEPPCNFEVYFPTGEVVLINNTTFYKLTVGETTYYPLMERVIDERIFYIAKSTPIVLLWQPTYDPDPEDGIYEYAVFISTRGEPKNETNAWRYVANSTLNVPPFEYTDWFRRWDFFVSTMITKTIEPGTQEGYELRLIENTKYMFRIRALDAPQNLYWIWPSTETFSPTLIEDPLSFYVDFISEAPTNYSIITPTGTVNPISLEGPIYFEWTKPMDPDPFDSIKHYFLNISTFIPQNPDEWYTVSCWKVNIYLDNSEITSATVILHTLKPAVTYYWQVHCWGKNEWDFAVNPSTSQPYLVKPYGMALATGSFVVSNQKPNKFNLVSPGVPVNYPLVGVKTYRPTFYWEQVYDPDRYDSVVSSYVVIISSFANFSYHYSFYTSTTRFVLNIDLNPRTTYYWYVKAYDKFGNCQTPFSTFYFCTVNFEPNSFELVYPQDDEVIETLNPKFGFKNRGDPDRDILYYKLYISSFSDFSQYQMYSVATNIGKTLGETIDVEIPFVFEENKRYFWQVVADDNYGGVSSSTIYSFWINSVEELPMSFDIIVTSGVLRNRFTSFSWQQTYDRDPKDFIAHYKIIFSSVESYAVGFSTYIIIFGSTTFSMDLLNLKENALYRWWVEAYDTKGNCTKSFSSYDFIVDLRDDEPDDFYLISPGSTYAFVRVSQPINFSWSKANKTEWWKFIKYKIYLAEDGQSTYTPFKEIVAGPYRNYDEPLFIVYSTSSLKENTTYYWFVLAENSVGTKVTQVNYFFVDSQNDPPEHFEILYPTSVVFTRKPTFSWQSTFDKDDEVLYYELKFSTMQNFKINFTTTVVIYYPTTTYSVDFKLLMDATYYWKVRAYDSRGLWRESQILQFYIPYFKPKPVEILSPKGEICLRKPTFEWTLSQHLEPNSRIEKYRLELYSVDDNTQQPIISVEITTNTYQLQNSLAQNTTYYCKVYAIDDEGIESDSCQVNFFVKVVDIPSKVKNLTYDYQQYKFSLYWQKVETYTDGSFADDIVGYNIYRAQDYFVLLTTNTVYRFVPSSVTFFTDYIYFNTYYYLIKTVAKGNVESPPSDVVSSLDSGSRIVYFFNTLTFIPKNVDEEIKQLGYNLILTTAPVEEEELNRLNIVAKYKLELTKNNKIINHKFIQPITLQVILKEDELLQRTNSSFVDSYFKPMVFFNNGFEYIPVQNIYEGDSLKFLARNTGEYVIRNVIYNDKEPNIVNIYPKKIFTPTSTQDNKIHFVIYNPTTFTPEGEIYDLNLRYISRLKLENTELVWDGRDDTGEVVPKGIYIYKIKVGEKTFTGTIIVAK